MKRRWSMALAGAALAAAGLCSAAPAMAQKAAPKKVSAVGPTGPGSLEGVWTPADFDRNVFRPAGKNAVRTIEGTPPPLLPWATNLIEERRRAAAAGRPFAGLQSRCIPSGMPQMMFSSGLPKQTLETPGQITMLSEELAFFRIIRLDVPHGEDPDPTYMGDSVGHWEGPTLVVDTIAIRGETQLPEGIPHGDQLHIVERFTRTSRDRIELLMTFEDPKAFARPWTTVTHLKLESNRRIAEYYCENNRNLPKGDATTVVLPGAR